MHKKEERDFELFIVDTLVSIYKVKCYTTGFKSGHDLQHSSLHWDATMRAFEIIGESLNYLLGNENFENLSPSYFRKIVNFRNVIAHGYFGIDAEEVWDIITQKLEDLNKDLLYVANAQFDIKEALESTIREYSARDEKITHYLQMLL
ncbi:MAG: DUF86 domain-containing protein [Campylobacterales bacterium]|nr:DUF86 domain-containing protein [Campylobacterales bacterium]